MSFSELAPSKQWAALTLRGEKIAEVWFKPEGEPLALRFRIPRNSFQILGVGQRLTIENLLKAVGTATDEVESWRQGDASHTSLETNLGDLLAQLPLNDDHLEIHVCLKPLPEVVAHEVGGKPDTAPAEGPDLESQWKAVLGLEATVDTLRISMEGIRAELEATLRRSLPADEKVNALAADVAQWTKAKNRAHFALPKASEFIHRATWAAGAPDRKKLGEFFKNVIETQTSIPQATEVLQELEILRKDRQVLSAQGVTVYQECKAIVADIQGALRRLQTNAAIRASKKKGGTGAKGKSF